MRVTRSQTKKSPKAAVSATDSDRRNWGNIFNLLVQMIRKQQNQLESFAMQHKFLEDRLRMQHESWVSDIRLYKGQISQMKGILKFEEKKRMLDSAQADLALGYKKKEASICKWILEQTEDELGDFKAWFEMFSRKCSNEEDQGTISKSTGKRKRGNNTEEEKSYSKMKDDLKRLKEECEKLGLENKFAWNQFNIMQKNNDVKLRAKQAETKKANEKIAALISSTEQLQSENSKKDITISQLVSKVADMEAEISRLSVELQSSRKPRKDHVTHILRPCTEGTKNSDPGTSNSGRRKTSEPGTSKSGKERKATLKKEISTPNAPAPANLSGKGNTSRLKGKEGTVTLDSETPKLFSLSFKVPKLKPSSKA